MLTIGGKEPIPFVDYYCACSSKKEKDIPTSATAQSAENSLALTAESEASVTGRHLLSNQASNYLYPLSRLYFCEDCHQIRCPSCVQDEIVSYYCPNCLFEVGPFKKSNLLLI
jgi:dynactin-4